MGPPQLRRVGWLLLGISMVALAGWVLVRAIQARGNTDAFQHWTNWSNVLALVVGAVGGAIVVLDRLRRASPPEGASLERALDDLAVSVDRQCAVEALYREVSAPAPMRILWSSTGRAAASRQVVLQEPEGPGWALMPLSGRLGGFNQDIVEKFLALPHRQLVVLGQAAAGKSVFGLLLARELIRRRGTDREVPVPVLLPINMWNPRESMEDFVVRRLAEEYAHELRQAGEPMDVARRLLRHRRVLPVLDGLDELELTVQAPAAEALELFTAPDQSAVVTSRPEAYEQVVHRVGVLSRAAVVELEPVRVDDAITFLSQPAYDARWEPVFEHLRTHRDGPLAATLSSPLTVGLARVAFRHPATDPAELLTLTTREAITARLMDVFVAEIGAPRRRTRRRGATARWLQCLAYHLDQTGTRDFRWWQVDPKLLAVHPRRTAVITRCAAVLLVAVTGGATAWATGQSPGTGAVTAAVIALVAASGVLRPLWPHSFPRWTPSKYRTTRRRRVLRLAGWLGYGIWCGMLVEPLTGEVAAVLAGAAWGVIAHCLATWWTPARSATADVPNDLVRNRRNIVIAGAGHGVGSGSTFALLGLATGMPHPVVFGITAAVVHGTQAGLAAGGWRWLLFRTTHLRLCWQGWLPGLLWSFLAFAHRRGALRRAGSVYQFRHVLLQRHLSEAVRHHHLRSRAEAGNSEARRLWAGVLIAQGRVDDALATLRAMAEAGDSRARQRLVPLLARHGRLDELRAWADTGDGLAVNLLIDMLTEREEIDEALAILRRAPDAMDSQGAKRLVASLAKQGRVDALRSLAEAGDWRAANHLANVLTRQDRVDDAIAFLSLRADSGDWRAANQVTSLLKQQGRVDELRARAAAGDRRASRGLVELLEEQGLIDDAIAVQRVYTNADSWIAANELARLLVKRGRVDDAIALQRPHAEAGPLRTVIWLAAVLVGRDRLDEAIELLRVRAAEEGSESEPLVDLLVALGRLDELRARADAGDRGAARRLVDVLAEQGAMDELDARAVAGDRGAANWLVRLLLAEGRIEEAMAVERVSDLSAAAELVDVLVARGQVDDALAVLRARSHSYRSENWRLVKLLTQHGRVEELRARADAGDQLAAARLDELLAQEGRVEELRARADAGDQKAVAWLTAVLARRGSDEDVDAFLRATRDADDRRRYDWLIEWLVNCGRVDHIIATLQDHAAGGDMRSAGRLRELLAQQGRVDELRIRVDAGDGRAARHLAEMLAERGQIEDAIALLNTRIEAPDRKAVLWLNKLLAQHGRVDELRTRVDAGDRYAASEFARLLAQQNRVDELRTRAIDGDQAASDQLVELLVAKGETDEAVAILRDRSITGDWKAACQLARLVHGQATPPAPEPT